MTSLTVDKGLFDKLYNWADSNRIPFRAMVGCRVTDTRPTIEFLMYEPDWDDWNNLPENNS